MQGLSRSKILRWHKLLKEDHEYTMNLDAFTNVLMFPKAAAE